MGSWYSCLFGENGSNLDESLDLLDLNVNDRFRVPNYR